MFYCICYCRWILSCSNLHNFLYLLLQMNSQLFQPPCFLVFIIAHEFSVVPTSMFSCICYCRWILSCSNLHNFLYLLLQMNSQLFQPPCFLVFVSADEFSVVPTSMFSCICYCRWILNCSKSAITNTRKHGGWNNWEFICNNKYKKTWRLEQLRFHLQWQLQENMEVATTENSPAITNTRKHGGWNNWEFICTNKYKKTWRLEQLRIHLQ